MSLTKKTPVFVKTYLGLLHACPRAFDTGDHPSPLSLITISCFVFLPLSLPFSAPYALLIAFPSPAFQFWLFPQA